MDERDRERTKRPKNKEVRKVEQIYLQITPLNLSEMKLRNPFLSLCPVLFFLQNYQRCLTTCPRGPSGKINLVGLQLPFIFLYFYPLPSFLPSFVRSFVSLFVCCLVSFSNYDFARISAGVRVWEINRKMISEKLLHSKISKIQKRINLCVGYAPS